MFRNYFHTALRHLRRHSTYAALSVVGLAVGMACCVLILLDIQYEVSFESFHENADRIYFLHWDDVVREATVHARRLSQEIPEIEAVVRTSSPDGQPRPLLSHGESQIYQRVTFSDDNVFEVFSFSLMRGDVRTALREPYSMVLCQSVARKLFGDEDPVGKTVLWDNAFEYQITGVMHDIPRNTHHPVEVLVSARTVEVGTEHGGFQGRTYLMLPRGCAQEDIGRKVLDFCHRHLGEVSENAALPYLQPMRQIHLNESRRAYLYSLVAVGSFILLVACINFTNLASARAATRAQEVGLRKAVGALRWQLATQFLGESLLMAMLGLVLALLIVRLVLPEYCDYTGKPLTIDPLSNLPLLAGSAVLTLLVGLLAGSYPALVLSGLRPVGSLKGRAQDGTSNLRLRRGLVIFQFIVACALFTGTGIVNQQLQYIRAMDLGLNTDRVVTTLMQNQEVVERLPVLRSLWLEDPRILGVTVSSTIPPVIAQGTYRVPGQGDPHPAQLLSVDEHFVGTYGLDLVAGRDFMSDAFASDRDACLVTESMVESLGLGGPEEAIGQQIDWRSSVWFRFRHMDSGETYRDRSGTVVGVVKDAHFRSLHHRIESTILFPEISWRNYLSIRIDAADMPGALEHLESTWDQVVPTLPLEWVFLDDSLRTSYRSEDRLGKVTGAFAGLAMIITCLGVFGLTSFSASRRTREIGVRKVVGASTWRIVLLLSSETMRLALLAWMVAAPLSWFTMDRWLQSFAYRLHPGPGVFVAAGLAVLGVAWLAIAPLAARAARANPAGALRQE